MIKLTNILNENKGTTLNLATPVNRKILSALLKYHPELIEHQKKYQRHSITTEYYRSVIYKTIQKFLSQNVNINDRDIQNEVALLFLINPNIHDPKKDELFDGSDLYLTIFEYADDEIYERDEEDNVECQSCDGWGYEECYECDGTGYEECSDCEGEGNETCTYCDGSGEIEDEYGEEGDTLVCDECDGSGNVDCHDCEGDGTIAEDYVEFELEYHKKYFISYEPLDSINEELTTDPIEEFVKVNEDKPMFLWYDNIWSETSKDGTDDIVYEPNELIDQITNKMTDWDLKYML